ncbi:conserved hypothetical protein [Culex quinquefasciatus]|uniref:Uncharacterized protein n=1 Tax=Culex quinquefasciatus TaxID=7176 RepID=B0W1N1_CULQU|nr:conserved hypothetical protein [Culex quinquefasciatus]|eukprot:XP_001842615.1 conserved hypothetical protein [Culex quinquefasciatus]
MLEEATGQDIATGTWLLLPQVEKVEGHNKNRPLFSPRMEYNEWLPVGRGDPLKNDPTYDYSPPVLDRVRYWSENLANKDKGNDILLLGVPSKKAINQQKAIVEQQQPQQVPWGSNSGPMRRNYYHHQINQLPTVLMPPPLNNHLQPDGGDGYLWTQASTHQAQRYEGLPQGEGFRYRPQPGPIPQQQHQPQPHPGHSFQYQGPKYTEPPMYHMNSFHQQAVHPSQQQYTTTLRLTTPNDIGHGNPKKPILHTILQNEKAYPFTKTAMTNTITEYTSSFYNPQNINAMATTIIHPPQTTEYLTAEPTKVFPTVSTSMKAPFVTPETYVSPVTSTTTTTTTTSTTMRPYQQTMDPVLAQFNQPPRPVAPLYLIIEGHSKVKTYGLNNNDTLMQLPKLVPVIGSEDPVIRHVVSRDDTGGALQVPHVTMKPSTTTTTTATPPTTSKTPPAEPSTSDEETSEEKSAVNSILSLLDASFGNFLLNGESGGNSLDSGEGDKDSKARRNARSARELESQQVYVIGSFQVGDQQLEATGDGYRRGVVFDETSASIDRDALKQ